MDFVQQPLLLQACYII